MIKEVESKHKVRFLDCDPIGHLSNIRYFDYMLNAREDHSIEAFGIDNFEHSKKTGCLWVALQNQIAYLKEVKYNKHVVITSKIIKYSERTNTAEILMYNEDKTVIHAVLWATLIYFNLVSRKSVDQPKKFMELFGNICVPIQEDLFEERVNILRLQNKNSQPK